MMTYNAAGITFKLFDNNKNDIEPHRLKLISNVLEFCHYKSDDSQKERIRNNFKSHISSAISDCIHSQKSNLTDLYTCIYYIGNKLECSDQIIKNFILEALDNTGQFSSNTKFTDEKNHFQNFLKSGKNINFNQEETIYLSHFDQSLKVSSTDSTQEVLLNILSQSNIKSKDGVITDNIMKLKELNESHALLQKLKETLNDDDPTTQLFSLNKSHTLLQKLKQTLNDNDPTTQLFSLNKSHTLLEKLKQTLNDDDPTTTQLSLLDQSITLLKDLDKTLNDDDPTTQLSSLNDSHRTLKEIKTILKIEEEEEEAPNKKIIENIKTFFTDLEELTTASNTFILGLEKEIAENPPEYTPIKEQKGKNYLLTLGDHINNIFESNKEIFSQFKGRIDLLDPKKLSKYIDEHPPTESNFEEKIRKSLQETHAEHDYIAELNDKLGKLKEEKQILSQSITNTFYQLPRNYQNINCDFTIKEDEDDLDNLSQISLYLTAIKVTKEYNDIIDVSEKDKEIEALKSSLEKYELYRDGIKISVLDLKKEMDDLQKKYAEVMKKLDIKDTKIKEFEQENKDIKSQSETVIKSMENLQNLYDEQIKTNQKLNDDNVRLRESNEIFSKANEEISKKDTELINLQSLLDKYKAHVNKLSSDNDNLKEDNDALREDIGSKEAKIIELEDKNKNIESEFGELKIKCDNLIELNKQLNTENTNMKEAHAEDLESSEAYIEKREQELKKEKEDLNNNYTEKLNQFNETLKELSNNNTNNEELLSQLHANEIRNERLQTELDLLKHEISNKTAEINTLNDNILTKNNNIENLAHSIAINSQSLNELKTSIHIKDQDIERLNTLLSDKENTIQEIRKKYDLLIKEKDDLYKNNQEYEALIEKYLEDITNLQENLNNSDQVPRTIYDQLASNFKYLQIELSNLHQIKNLINNYDPNQDPILNSFQGEDIINELLRRINYVHAQKISKDKEMLLVEDKMQHLSNLRNILENQNQTYKDMKATLIDLSRKSREKLSNIRSDAGLNDTSKYDACTILEVSKSNYEYLNKILAKIDQTLNERKMHHSQISTKLNLTNFDTRRIAWPINNFPFTPPNIKRDVRFATTSNKNKTKNVSLFDSNKKNQLGDTFLTPYKAVEGRKQELKPMNEFGNGYTTPNNKSNVRPATTGKKYKKEISPSRDEQLLAMDRLTNHKTKKNRRRNAS